jgi:uncharacterized damage-inducible protein DinB
MDGSAKTLAGLYGMTEFMIPMVLDDLSDDEACARPRGEGGPSIVWTIGHLLSYRIFMLKRFGSELDDPYAEKFRDAPATDGSDYPSMAELRAAWEAVSGDFMDAVSSLSEEQLDAPLEDGWHEEQVLRDQVVFFAWHEGYHMGAIGQVRKALGLLGPAERVMATRAEDVAEAAEVMPGRADGGSPSA